MPVCTDVAADAAAGACQQRATRNPFRSRRDRIAFPTMTQAMWECSPGDTFDTPGSGGTPLGINAWTPAGFTSPAITSPEINGNSDGADAYFAERECLGLITPATSPSDILRRGSLYDPNHVSSSPSSTASFMPRSSCSVTPSPVGNGEVSGNVGCRSSSSSAASSAKRRARNASTPVVQKVGLPRSDSHVGIGVVPATAMTLQCASDRNDVSISFGREDARMNTGEPHGEFALGRARCGDEMRVEPTIQQEARRGALSQPPRMPQSLKHHGAQAESRTSKVARQLDFGCAASTLALATVPSPARAVNAPALAGGIVPSVKDACTSLVRCPSDRPTSPRRDVPHGSAASPSIDVSSPIKEFSPLRSWSTSDDSLALSSASAVALEAVPLSLLSGEQLPAAVEGISVAETPDGGTVLQLLLRGCACAIGQMTSAASCARVTQQTCADEVRNQIVVSAANGGDRSRGGNVRNNGADSATCPFCCRSREAQTGGGHLLSRRRHRQHQRQHVIPIGSRPRAPAAVAHKKQRSNSACAIGVSSGTLATCGAPALTPHMTGIMHAEASLQHLRSGFGAIRARYLEDVVRLQLRR